MTEHEQLRLQHWRLKIIQEATAKPRNIAPVCRRYHISRQTFSKWHKRYLAKGEAGLRDQPQGPHPQGPHHCPRATHPDIVEKILYLHRHYNFGAVRISLYLRRYHDLIMAQRTIQRILKRRGLNRLPQNMCHKPHKQRWRRYEKPLPGHRLQIDAKFLEPIPGRRKSYWQFTAIE